MIICSWLFQAHELVGSSWAFIVGGGKNGGDLLRGSQ